MNDAVDRLIIERSALDAGFAGGMTLSIGAHFFVVVFAIGIPLLFPTKPPKTEWTMMAVPLPGGGKGSPDGGARAPDIKKPEPAPPKPEPEAPKILKPPKEEIRKGLPELDERKKKPTKATPAPAKAGTGAASAAAGRTSETPGLGLRLPAGPGAGEGSDILGDWYLAGVQRKIWQIWAQQMTTGLQKPVTVRFTIREDGSVDPDVIVVDSSGVTLLDRSAQRSVVSAAPFGPLPKTYGTNRFTIQAIFKPTE